MKLITTKANPERVIYHILLSMSDAMGKARLTALGLKEGT